MARARPANAGRRGSQNAELWWHLAGTGALGRIRPIEYTSSVVRDHRELERLAAELASLTPEERARVLAAAARRMRDKEQGTAGAYLAVPPGSEEFTSDEDALAWEGEGWDEFDAPR